jgi:flagellin-specific chaperone FliS
MRTQAQIQHELTDLIQELSQKNVSNPQDPINEVVRGFPDIKEKWDKLMAEAEELRASGGWKVQ